MFAEESPSCKLAAMATGRTPEDTMVAETLSAMEDLGQKLEALAAEMDGAARSGAGWSPGAIWLRTRELDPAQAHVDELQGRLATLNLDPLRMRELVRRATAPRRRAPFGR